MAIKYMCDICGKELSNNSNGYLGVHTEASLRKYTKRKNGEISCNYVSSPNGSVRKGFVDLILCTKCGDACEKALVKEINRLKEA
ncbi:MAG: hypothetical protein LIR46_01570 [Bacteroidota bacterium]|nr:hypothetical protein [Bacteroidota bacterium]